MGTLLPLPLLPATPALLCAAKACRRWLVLKPASLTGSSSIPRPPAAFRLAGLSLWDPRLGAVFIQHTGAGALLTVLETDEAGVDCMEPDTWPRSGMTIQDPAVPFWIEPLDVGRR